MAIYACGVFSGISCAYLVLTTTFGKRSDLRDHSVRIFGLRGPLGSFMAAWGGICLLVSAPFDNWWHSAYGLDVRFTSPPHLMVSLGLWFVMMGSILLVLSYLNPRRSGRCRLRLPQDAAADAVHGRPRHRGADVCLHQLHVGLQTA